MKYEVGDLVKYMVPPMVGEAYFIGHPDNDKKDKVLVLARGAQIGMLVNTRTAGRCRARRRQRPALPCGSDT